MDIHHDRDEMPSWPLRNMQVKYERPESGQHRVRKLEVTLHPIEHPEGSRLSQLRAAGRAPVQTGELGCGLGGHRVSSAAQSRRDSADSSKATTVAGPRLSCFASSPPTDGLFLV